VESLDASSWVGIKRIKYCLNDMLILLQQTELHAPGAGNACAIPGGRVAQWPPFV
jgi:hypothetical protein